MNNDDPHIYLRDFVAWVRLRRSFNKNAWVGEDTLEYVTQGIELFLDGKNPWPKQKGNKQNKNKMWECFYLTSFAEGDVLHLPQHKDDGGAYQIAGERLNISASTVESHVRKARALLESQEGRAEFSHWLAEYKGVAMAGYFPSNHPEAIAERERRESLGLMKSPDEPKRGRPTKGISGENDA